MGKSTKRVLSSVSSGSGASSPLISRCLNTDTLWSWFAMLNSAILAADWSSSKVEGIDSERKALCAIFSAMVAIAAMLDSFGDSDLK